MNHDQESKNNLNTHTSIDPFRGKLDGIIRSNLINGHFGVSELALIMSLSRMQLYRKVRKVTGRNVSQYIKEKRLEYALDMLKKQDKTVSEVAYETGFGSISYFSKCFRNFYGYPPGQVKTMVKNDDLEIADALKVRPVIKKKAKMLKAIAGLLILCGIYLTYRSISGINFSNTGFASQENSIAVLPFIVVSPDMEVEYFCNGLMEEILIQLQKVPDLSVKSRKDVEKYRDKNEKISVIGVELGVAFVLEGKVRIIKDKVRITTKLIDVRSGDPIWSETFEGKYAEKVFEFQSNTAKKVVASLLLPVQN